MARIVDLVKDFTSGYERNKAKASSVTVQNGKIFSYNTVVAELTDSGVLLVNVTKYSATTSRLQNTIMRFALYYGLSMTKVTDIPMNTQKLSN